MKKLRIGILGCGAIGSRIAKSVATELKSDCELSGVFDCSQAKMVALSQNLKKRNIVKRSLNELIKSCDVMVEAVNAQTTEQFIFTALSAKKHVLAMSVGKLLNQERLFKLAKKNRCQILIPTGAIAGVDALKAASLVKLDKITLTTRKPLQGFIQSEYLTKKNIQLTTLTKETILFDGSVREAVKYFPQNINVAATLALASQHPEKIRVRIITSPEYTINSHEIEYSGEFGKVITRAENVTCPDNPKTSYLAVLSAIKTLSDFCTGSRIGT